MNQMPRMESAAQPEKTAHDTVVGRRLRALRKQKKMSLQTLAAETGLSIGYISQIERGISSASVRALAVIADGLGSGFDRIFLPDVAGQPPGDTFAFRVSERRSLGFWRDGIEKELLTPSEGGTINLYLVHLAPGGCSGEAAYTHSGAEAGFVLDGAFELSVDTMTHTLETGDSFRFQSNRPHRWRNVHQEPCRILWVLSSG